MTTPVRPTASATNIATTAIIANAALEEDNHAHVANVVTSQ